MGASPVDYDPGLAALLETTYLHDYTDPQLRTHVDAMWDAKHQADRLAGAAHPLLFQAYKPTIQKYCGSFSAFLNGSLLKHEGDTSKFEDTLFTTGDHLRKLDSGMQSMFKSAAAPLPERAHVFSGVGRDFGRHLASLKPGDTLHSHAYISWSTDGVIATNRASGVEVTPQDFRPRPPVYDRHFIHMHTPEGYTGGIFVGGVSQYDHEREMITNRATNFRYLGSTRGKENPETGHTFVMHHVEPMA